MSNKINNDKYYTPNDIVVRCLNELAKIIREDNVKPSLVIEPSAGNGAFSSKLKGCVAYDIEPEADGIIKQDFLELKQEYVKNSIIVGNPPFGRCLNLAQKFFKKATLISDYIAFILPISQLNNNKTFYEFDLIKSIDLGKDVVYTDRKLHCCFNIYKRPKHGLNKKEDSKLKSVKIIRQDSKTYESDWFDIRMCYWGNGSAGKILKNSEDKYSGEYKIQVSEEFRNDVIKVLECVDWKTELNAIAMLRIKQYDIINLLKREIPNIY